MLEDHKTGRQAPPPADRLRGISQKHRARAAIMREQRVGFELVTRSEPRGLHGLLFSIGIAQRTSTAVDF
jgi:hypothetical protein